MLRKYKIIMALFLVAMIATSCQKNYYSAKAKKGDCGCPNTKAMVGY
jgi:hypothetical protein